MPSGRTRSLCPETSGPRKGSASQAQMLSHGGPCWSLSATPDQLSSAVVADTEEITLEDTRWPHFYVQNREKSSSSFSSALFKLLFHKAKGGNN